MTIAFIAVIGLLIAYGYATGSQLAISAASSGSGSQGDNAPQTSGNNSGVSVYNSDASLTGSLITNDTSTWPGSDKLWNVCAAIALAEGYNLGPGTAPYDLNNPGDLSPGDEGGEQTCGTPQFHDGSAIIAFCTAEGGWEALYYKFNNIVGGRSTIYPASYTWTQVAQKYAGNSSAWVSNVTSYLGVDPSSTPAQYVNS
jgi:hypothetical protein